MEFDVPSGPFSDVEYVLVGDMPGGNFTSTVRYRISGAQETILAIKNPNVRVTSSSNASLELVPGDYDLSIMCMESNADLDGDGLVPDTIVVVEFINQ